MDPVVQTLRRLVENFLTTTPPNPSKWVLHAPQNRVQKWWELQFTTITHSDEWEVLQYYLLNMPVGTTLPIMAKSFGTGNGIMELFYSLEDGFFIQTEYGNMCTDVRGSAELLAAAIIENILSSDVLAFASLRNLIARAVRDDISQQQNDLGNEAALAGRRTRAAFDRKVQMGDSARFGVTAAQE